MVGHIWKMGKVVVIVVVGRQKKRKNSSGYFIFEDKKGRTIVRFYAIREQWERQRWKDTRQPVALFEESLTCLAAQNFPPSQHIPLGHGALILTAANFNMCSYMQNTHRHQPMFQNLVENSGSSWDNSRCWKRGTTPGDNYCCWMTCECESYKVKKMKNKNKTHKHPHACTSIILIGVCLPFRHSK